MVSLFLRSKIGHYLAHFLAPKIFKERALIPLQKATENSMSMKDRTDSQWLEELALADSQAIADLREILFKGMSRGLGGKADSSAIEDFAQEAVLKILERRDSFRGEGRFLSWALAISMRVAFSELRKARWKDVSFDSMSQAARFNLEPAVLDQPPEDEGKNKVLWTLRKLIGVSLTERQRTVILAELEGMPQVVIAERLGINRNALYKLGHDARMKLKQTLLDEGISAEEVRLAFAATS